MCLHVSMYTCEFRYQQSSEEGDSFPGAGVPAGCGQPDVSMGNFTGFSVRAVYALNLNFRAIPL